MSIDNIEVRPTPPIEKGKKPGVLSVLPDTGRILSKRELRDFNKDSNGGKQQDHRSNGYPPALSAVEVMEKDSSGDPHDADVLDRQFKTDLSAPETKPSLEVTHEADEKKAAELREKEPRLVRLGRDLKYTWRRHQKIRGILHYGLPVGFIAGFMGGQAIQQQQDINSHVASPPGIVAPRNPDISPNPETTSTRVESQQLIFDLANLTGTIVPQEGETLNQVITKSITSYIPENAIPEGLPNFLEDITIELNKDPKTNQQKEFRVGEEYRLLDKHYRNLVIQLYIGGQNYKASIIGDMESYRFDLPEKKQQTVKNMIAFLRALRGLNPADVSKKIEDLKPGESRKSNGKIYANIPAQGDKQAERVEIPVT